MTSAGLRSTPPHSGHSLSDVKTSEALDQLAAAEWNYPGVGATAGTLPDGYDHIRRDRVLGHGPATYTAASAQLLSWQLHRRSGLTVQASSATAAEGVNVLLGFGMGRLRLGMPCRVMQVVDEPTRQGFAYGTLVGHPESGEERFVVEMRDSGEVVIVVTAFAKPALWWSRLGRPLGRRVQEAVTDRYLAALRADLPAA